MGRNNPLFNDITPIPQDDGPHPVVQIAYSENFKDCYDYFRAIYEKHELSERAMELTDACIKFNPANYTVWEYRRQIVKELILSFKDEVKQEDVDRELELVKFVVSNDSKNYHAWQHRISLLQNPIFKPFFSLQKETNYAHHLIAKDYRNNSAWNYLFTINDIFNSWDNFDFEYLGKTIFTTNSNDLMNESSWSFLSGCFKFMSDSQKLSFFNKTVDLVVSLHQDLTVPHVMVAFLLDHYKKMEFSVEQMKDFVKGLEKSDPVRIGYWKYIQSVLV